MSVINTLYGRLCRNTDLLERDIYFSFGFTYYLEITRIVIFVGDSDTDFSFSIL